MRQYFITTYLSSSNLVERHHSSLKKCIAKFCKKDVPCWDEIIPYACMVQNIFPHTLEDESAMFKMFGGDPIVPDMENMFQPKCRYFGDQNPFIDLEALHTLHMEIGARLKQARLKKARNYPTNTISPKVGDAVLFCNHQKTGFAPTFIPRFRVVKKIDDSNYFIKHVITSQTSQVPLKDQIVSPMIRQVLYNLPPVETFGRYGKYANCPKIALKD